MTLTVDLVPLLLIIILLAVLTVLLLVGLLVLLAILLWVRPVVEDMRQVTEDVQGGISQ